MKRSEDVSDEDSETFHPPRKIVITTLGLIVLASAVGVVWAFASFQQILPPITIQAAFTVTPCSASLTEVGTVTPGSGVVMYDCSTSPAFTVTGSGSATPTFTIPVSPSTVTANLGITSNGSCATFTGLISGSPTPLVSGGYDYCLSYSNVPSSGGTVGPVTISWS